MAITTIPRDVRQNIFFLLPPEDLVTLPKICKLFNEDLSNEFFHKKSVDVFQSLNSNFCDPIIKTVKNPWKLICFSLSGLKKNDQFYPVAQKAAQTFHQEFSSYLSKCADLTKLEQTNLESDKQSICGKYYQDPNSKIDQAWKFFQENWSEQDENELNALIAYLVQTEEPGLQYWRNVLLEIWATLDYSSLDDSLSNELKKRHADTLVIRCAELDSKKEKAKQQYEQFENERNELEILISEKNKIINCYNKITQNPESCQRYSTEIIYHILYLLPYMRKWGDHLPTLRALSDEIGDEGLKDSPEGIDSIRDKINSLPKDVSTFIWKTLYDRKAQGVQEEQWSEKHFQEHLRELENIIDPIGSDLRSFLNYDFNKNPAQNSDFLAAFVNSKNINFNYPCCSRDLNFLREDRDWDNIMNMPMLLQNYLRHSHPLQNHYPIPRDPRGG
jgi:hypothetical protein